MVPFTQADRGAVGEAWCEILGGALSVGAVGSLPADGDDGSAAPRECLLSLAWWEAAGAAPHTWLVLAPADEARKSVAPALRKARGA